MFAVMWSEHCGYKYSRPILSYFSGYKKALEGDGLENAGIVDIGDGIGITMKVESHNHPSAVEPYQGAATGVGGIIRDIFTMGARPIASLNSLRFGPITPGSAPDEVVKRNQYLFKRVVAGIGGYGNCVGVPTVAGEVFFHPRYSGNPLVNAMSVGVVPVNQIATAKAAGIGNPVIYLGSATGKDGIHGATFASDALDEDGADKRPNVQIGDPFAEKQLIEATLEALETGAVIAIQDMGAAGITCSTTEMASKGGVGMHIELARVPAREAGMSAYELMLSESQERMLAVAKKGRQDEVLAIFRKWGLKAEVIGTVTEGPFVEIFYHGELVAQVNPKHLTDECPTYSTAIEVPEYHRSAQEFDATGLAELPLSDSLLKLMGSPNLASKRWVYQQYDTQVQTQTALPPGTADAAVLALRGSKRGISLKIDGNARQTYFDPYVGGLLAVCEAARNVACTGARPRAATDGLNFGNPQLGHVYWQFERAVRGIADACEALGTPVLSGNVSFYNESNLGEVLPTPLIGMLGVLEDANRRIGSALPTRRADLMLVSTPLDEMRHDALGASEYLATVHGIEDGLPVAPNLAGELSLIDFLVRAAEGSLLEAAHDVSEGGVAVALAEMAIPNTVGIIASLKGEPFEFSNRKDARWFGETPGRAVIAVRAENASAVADLAGLVGVRLSHLGKARPEEPRFELDEVKLNLEDLRLVFQRSIPQTMGIMES